MELVSVCICRGKVRFDRNDDAYICPHCGRWMDLISGVVDHVDASTLEGDRTCHRLEIDGCAYSFVCENTDFLVGSMITISFCQGKIVGVSDDSRKLYFPVWEPQPFRLKWLLVAVPVAGLAAGGPIPMLIAAALTAPLFLLKDPETPDFSGWGLD